jgi:hypothetical protein
MPSSGRQLGSFATIGSTVYYSGGAVNPNPLGNPALLEVLIAPCTGVTAPTNGALGTCTSSLAAGATCQFTCNDGYGASGPTSCYSSSTGVLTAATCAMNVWFSRNALPAVSLVPLQGALSFGTRMYTVANPPVGPVGVGASGDFHVYDSTSDLWATGNPPPPPSRARLLTSHFSGIVRCPF